MTQKFKFTCVANSYTLPGGGTYMRDQFLVVEEGDKRLLWLRGNRSFKEAVLGPVTVTKQTDTSRYGMFLADVLQDPRQLVPLHSAGLKTVGDVVIKSVEELVEIKGVGEVLAKKILAECNVALEQGRHFPPQPKDDDFDE